MPDSDFDDPTVISRLKTGGTGDETRTWFGWTASFAGRFLTVGATAVLGTVIGLIIASWYAATRVASIPVGAGGGPIGLAPNIGPELDMAIIWLVSLAIGGLLGLVVGVIAGLFVARAVAAALSRKKRSSSDF